MGLILGIIGASISFLLLILEKKEAKGKRTFLIVAEVGFLTLLGQQFVEHISSETSSRVIEDKNKTEVKQRLWRRQQRTSIGELQLYSTSFQILKNKVLKN